MDLVLKATYYVVFIFAAIVFYIIIRKLLSHQQRRKNVIASVTVLGVFSILALAVSFDAVQKLLPFLQGEKNHIILALLTIWWLVFAFTIDILVRFFVWDGIFTTTKGERIVPDLICNLISFVIYLLVVTLMMKVVYSYAVTGLAAASGGIALILGYSSKSLLGEAFTGIALSLGGNIRRDELIEIDGNLGVVIEMNWRSVKIKDFNNNVDIIPNKKLAAGIFINHSRPDTFYMHKLTVNLMPLTSPHKAIAMLKKAAGDCLNVLKTPEPKIFASKISLSIIEYTIFLYIDCKTFKPVVTNEIMIAIESRAKKENIEFSPVIMRVRQFLDTIKLSPANKLELSSERIIATLKSVKAFELFTSEEIQKLAEVAEYHQYYSPERVTIQHDVGSSLFVIESGDISTFVQTTDGKELKMRTLKPGDAFGLKGFLTGSERRVTTRPESYATVYEFQREDFSSIIQSRPEIMGQLSQLLISREEENKVKEGSYETSLLDEGKDSVGLRLVNKMKELFNIK